MTVIETVNCKSLLAGPPLLSLLILYKIIEKLGIEILWAREMGCIVVEKHHKLQIGCFYLITDLFLIKLRVKVNWLLV
jgi:hypothetical protein